MPRKARENTLAGFQLALKAGVDGLELDVHATADGVVVVHHDPRLAPSPPPPGGAVGPGGPRALPIAGHPLDVLRENAPYELPTLRDVLTLVPPAVTLYVEVKARGIEALVADVLRGHEGRCAVHAFDHRVAGRMRALLPTLPTGLLSSSYLLHPGRSLQEAGARDYWPWWESIDTPLVQAIHAEGGRVVAWTVNEADAVRHLAALGVDAICTDVPDEVGDVARGRTRR